MERPGGILALGAFGFLGRSNRQRVPIRNEPKLLKTKEGGDF
jgi:hypothetical protein